MENEENDFPRTDKKSTTLNDVLGANRDPEKYPFYPSPRSDAFLHSQDPKRTRTLGRTKGILFLIAAGHEMLAARLDRADSRHRHWLPSPLSTVSCPETWIMHRSKATRLAPMPMPGFPSGHPRGDSARYRRRHVDRPAFRRDAAAVCDASLHAGGARGGASDGRAVCSGRITWRHFPKSQGPHPGNGCGPCWSQFLVPGI
jgi:hypothetical protein